MDTNTPGVADQPATPDPTPPTPGSLVTPDQPAAPPTPPPPGDGPPPTSPPPPPPAPPAPPVDPPKPPAAPPADGDYHSNPFALLLNALGRALLSNGMVGLILSFLMGVVLIAIWALGFLVALVAKSGVILLVFGILFIMSLLATSAGLAAWAVGALEDKPASTGELFGLGFRKLLPLLGASILSFIVVVIGFVLLIIPGLWLSARLSLIVFAVVAEDLGPIAAMKRSWQLTKGHVFETWAMIVASAVVGGGLLSVLTSIVGFAGRYEEYKQLAESGAVKPRIHWMNFVLTIGVIVFYALYFGFLALFAKNLPKSPSTAPTIYGPASTTYTQPQ